MKFKSEVDLVNTFIEIVKNQYKNRTNLEIFSEVSLGFGIADVVIVNLIDQTIESREEKLDLYDINLYDLIYKHPEGISLEQISIILRGKKANIKASIKKLALLNFVSIDNDLFIINKEYLFPFRNNFAVEAKLRDWKKALKQAYRYKWFAEYSFVVMDEFYSKKAVENLHYFKKYNVGLVTISLENGLKRHHSPVAETPYDLKMKMLLSEMIYTQSCIC